ncbi:hypothetical protein B4N89_20830 [Embleya scabrispora]|uniref:Uncharacterized protein n=1 Tax=Embleya scabrispora TaxID=159449 RepID=A0A1T3P1U8_9ACTN|nr:hypothetical protein [Embleya scabrispora]OPC83058.1 hypothetical protein B4N89_20830 [Embleya scabrispora]
MNSTDPIPPETVADLLDRAADLIDTQGLLRHEAWTDRHEDGPLGAETAICVAATGRVYVRPMPPLVHTAIEMCAQVLCGSLDCWADNAAEDAAEVVELMRYTATHLREVAEQEAREVEDRPEEVAGTLAGDLVAARSSWESLVLAGRNRYATAVAA